MSGEWHVAEHKRGPLSQVYEGNRFVGEFVRPADARACVEAHNAGGDPVAWQWRKDCGHWHREAWESERAARSSAEAHLCDDALLRPLYTAPERTQDEWRPIEIAPKDGTEVDLWIAPLAENGAVLTPCRVPNAHFHCGEWLVYSGDPEVGYHTINHRITHWRPLLAPPGSSPTGAVDAVGIVEAMRGLTDDARMDVMSRFCKCCGSTDANCQCWNDE